MRDRFGSRNFHFFRENRFGIPTVYWCEYENIQSAIMEHFASVLPVFELYPFQASGARDTIISGLIEGQFPVERINGMPTDTIK